jgi:hypothetical protein
MRPVRIPLFYFDRRDAMAAAMRHLVERLA